MDSELVAQCYACYIKLMYQLMWGRFSLDYDILYDALLALNNNITDAKYIEFFKSNLNC